MMRKFGSLEFGVLKNYEIDEDKLNEIEQTKSKMNKALNELNWAVNNGVVTSFVNGKFLRYQPERVYKFSKELCKAVKHLGTLEHSAKLIK